MDALECDTASSTPTMCNESFGITPLCDFTIKEEKADIQRACSSTLYLAVDIGSQGRMAAQARQGPKEMGQTVVQREQL